MIRLIEYPDAQEIFNLVDANRSFLREWLPWLDFNTSLEDTKKFISSSLDDYSKNKSIFLKNQSQLDIKKNFSFTSILEFKYATKLDKYVRQNLNEITLRLSKNSKFVNSAFETPKFYS